MTGLEGCRKVRVGVRDFPGGRRDAGKEPDDCSCVNQVSVGTNGALVNSEETPVAAIPFVALTLAALYWFLMRRRFGRWGTTEADRTRVMAGDTAVVDPK